MTKQQYDPTERKGVNAVERAFLDIGWIFREQHTSDIGIDAQVEVCEHGRATGQILALQIKSGPSFFKEETDYEFIYRGELRHLEYWTNHSLPVILVLYNIRSGIAYWCSIKGGASVVRTEKGWYARVPKSQTVSMDMTNALREVSMTNSLRHARFRDLAPRIQGETKPSVFSALLDALQTADSGIEAASPTVDSQLFLALALCSHRVRVRLITGPLVPLDAIENFTSGDHAGIEWRTCLQLHAKFLLLDRFMIISGSPSFTRHSWRGENLEQVWSSCDHSMVAKFADEFREAWNGAASSSHLLGAPLRDPRSER